MTYYMTDLNTFNDNLQLFREGHWLVCDGVYVFACMCVDDDTRHTWDNTLGVTPFPDPLRNQPLGSLAADLPSLGLLATDTTFNLIDKLVKLNPAFKFDFR